ncbi:MAG: serine hydrolase [Bacteroidales bacterium]|nr:serine hydrolase [Bacteroidales bacterium]
MVFTDALNMKGVTNFFKNGEAEVKALEAGNDILVMSDDIPLAISKIKQAIITGRITEAQINESCKKVLILKEWAGLNRNEEISLLNLVKDLNNPQANHLNRTIVENALTVVKNNNDLIPVKNLESSRIAVVTIGSEVENEFDQTVGLYAEVDNFYLGKKANAETVTSLINNLSNYNLIIVGVMNTNFNPKRNYGVIGNAMDFLNRLSQRDKTILTVFAPPYFLNRIENLKGYKSIIVSYEDNPVTRECAAQLIFGGITAKGVLPVTAAPGIEFKHGLSTDQPSRLKYSVPEAVKINSNYLQKIDSIVNDAILKKAMPGCQILAAKDGTVFYHKAFGYHTYDSIRKVVLTDIYDIASITKVAATLPSIMKLYEAGSFKTTKSLSDYLPELKKTNKSEILMIDILTHQSRLQTYIPFHLSLLLPLNKSEKRVPKEFFVNHNVKLGYSYLANNSRRYKPGYLSDTASFTFGNQVCDSLFVLTSFEDTIFSRISSSSLLTNKEYRYSDLNFIYLYKVFNSISTIPLHEYTRQNFYTHLGAKTLGYWPLLRYDKNRIVPTELDLTFRQQLIHGYVHDQIASLMGGVSGHAGLFSNANDLAKLFQMYLNGGTYGGEKYFEKLLSTISIPHHSLQEETGVDWVLINPS